MEYHDFMWKGQLASSKGIIVEKQTQYVRPQERVERIEIPGRSGNLTLKSGKRAVFDIVLHAPQCYLSPGFKPEEMGEYLSGQGEVIFGSIPERKYKARLINQISFSSVDERIGGYYSFAAMFECQPYAYEINASQDITLLNVGTVTNKGNVFSLPIIKIYGDGDITLNTGSGVVEMKDVVGGILLDSDVQEAFNLDRTELLNNKLLGEFPVLETGSNTVVFSGNVSKIVITPKWRFL